MRRWLPGLAAALLLAGCQEKLTSPADCPTLCPSGQTAVHDTIIFPVYGTDSTFPGPNEGGPAEGFVGRGRGTAVLVSNGLPGADDRAVYRFASRPDSLIVQDTARSYTIDSAAISLPVVSRDSLAPGLALQLFLIDSAKADTSVTFDEVTQALAAAPALATVPVPDTMHSGVVRYLFTPAELDRIRDSNAVALAVALTAPGGPTGIRLATPFNSTPPQFIWYLHIQIPDTAFQTRIDTRPLVFSTWVSALPPALPDSQFLGVGGGPSRRALLRFELPPLIRDSATILRATLELTPAQPVPGLANDPGLLLARGVLSDLGAKSPLVSTSTVAPATDTLRAGSTTPVSLELGDLVRLWKRFPKLPTAVFLAVAPEASSFTEPLFYGTRSEPAGPPTPDTSLQPRLRITYVLPFNFGSQ